MDRPEDEFGDAIPIEKLYRVAFSKPVPGEQTIDAFFGLLGEDGVNRYFRCDNLTVWDIAEELTNIARAARLVRDRGNLDGFSPIHPRMDLPKSSDGGFAPFAAPMLKLNRAIIHIETLDSMIVRFAERATLIPRVLGEGATSKTWGFAYSERPPVTLATELGETLSNLRSALDIAIYDIARQRGITGEVLEHLAFPFAKTPSELERQISKRIMPLGDDVAMAVRALEPFEDGSTLLYRLHLLANIDKHRMIIPTIVSTYRQWDMGRDINELRAKEGKPPIQLNLVGEGFMHPITEATTMSLPNDQHPFDRYTPDLSYVGVQFPLGVPFASMDVVTTLTHLMEEVRAILLQFKSDFGPTDPFPV